MKCAEASGTRGNGERDSEGGIFVLKMDTGFGLILRETETEAERWLVVWQSWLPTVVIEARLGLGK